MIVDFRISKKVDPEPVFIMKTSYGYSDYLYAMKLHLVRIFCLHNWDYAVYHMGVGLLS